MPILHGNRLIGLLLILSFGGGAQAVPPGPPSLVPPTPVMEARVEGEALWIVWGNPNLRATYFLAGSLINMGQAMPRLSFRVTWKGREWDVIDRSVPGVIAGRLDPWIVTLPHGAEFRYRMWLRELAVIDHSTGQWWTLGSIGREGWRIEAVLSAAEGFAGQTPYPLWSGKLTARAEFKPGSGRPAGK